MVRSAIDPWLALGVVAIIAIPGPGFENLTNVWQVQLISPLALGLGALLLLPDRGRLGWRDGVASLLLTVGMACSGLGITMLGIVALVALVRRGWRVALAVAALPTVRVRMVVRRVREPAPRRHHALVPRGARVRVGRPDRCARRRRAAARPRRGHRARGVRLVGLSTRPPTAPRTVLFPAVLALGAVVSLTLTGWRPRPSPRGRCHGTRTSPSCWSSRWWPRRWTGWCGALRGGRFTKVVPIVTGVLLVVVVIAQVRIFDNYVDSIEEAKRVEKAAFLTTAELVREGHQLLNDRPMFIFEPQVTAEKIAAMDHDGKLPSLDGLREDDRHTVLARLDLALLPTAIAGLTQNPAAVQLGEVRRRDDDPRDRHPELCAARRVARRCHHAAGHEGTGGGRAAGRRTAGDARGAARRLGARRERLRRPRSQRRPGAQHRADRRSTRDAARCCSRCRGARPACAASREARVGRGARARIPRAGRPPRRRDTHVAGSMGSARHEVREVRRAPPQARVRPPGAGRVPRRRRIRQGVPARRPDDHEAGSPRRRADRGRAPGGRAHRRSRRPDPIGT